MEAYRIEDLARESGTTVRTIRAYQDRGLLPKPERRGRANVYGTVHLSRLRQIAGLLVRGYTLASIKELLEAWDTGTGLGGVLGLVNEMNRPWSDERPARIRRAVLTEAFGGRDDEAIAEAVSLGVLERIPGSGDAGDGEEGDEEFLVPSPQELAVAAELHRAGVPLLAISAHLRELRGQVEHIAARFMEFTIEHVFARFLEHQPTEAEATEAADLVRRLRPLAQQTVDAELARAMHALASGMVQQSPEASAPPFLTNPLVPTGLPRPRSGQDPAPVPALARAVAAGEPHQVDVPLPAATVGAVRSLVGPRNVAAFVTAAAEREVQARTMDALATTPHRHPEAP